MSIDATTITAIAGLVTALGGVIGLFVHHRSVIAHQEKTKGQ